VQPTIEIRREPAGGEPARSLLAAMEAEIAAVYGPLTRDHTSMVTAEEMAPPDGAYVVVYAGGRPVAGGGLRRVADGAAEIKRMYVVPEARGRGHGRRLLAGLEDAARWLGYDRVRLDTARRQTAAIALYESAGYSWIADYNGNEYASHWGEKVLG
jgi:GNAT superfamily N-acetyltransferase